MNTKTQNNISVGYGNSWPSGCVFIAPCPALFYLEINMEEKKCPRCKELKPVARFSKNKRCKDGLCCWCKECGIIKTSEWKAANIERVKIYNDTH